MQTINLKQFKYSLVEHPDDVTNISLRGTLFGLNGRIYANLASYDLKDEDREIYTKYFDEQDLRFALLNRLFQVHIHVREYNVEEEYMTHEAMDFKDVYDLVKKHAQKLKSGAMHIYASYNDAGNSTDVERGVILLPLGSKVLMHAANYAYQEIERVKMDNFMDNLSDAENTINFLNVF